MKRLFAAITFLMCTALSANAQSTVVSGTVTDTAAQTWNGGTFTFQLVANPRFPNLAQYTWTGGKLNQTIGGSLDGAGAYSQSVPSNSEISPQGSTWQLKVCPLATASCSLTADITITGATQILNVTPPAIAINLLNPDQFITAYTDSEIVTAFIGGQYYNLTTQLMRDCTTVAGQACTVWVNVGASGALLFIGVPTGSCLASQTAVDTVTGNFYNCLGGVWHLVGPGTGTLTSPVTSPNPLAFDVNVAFKGPNPYIDATRFGVRAVAAVPTATVSCINGSPNVLLGSAPAFVNGDGVALYGCGAGTIGAPAAPTVTPSLAAAQTGLLLDVPGPVGATQYCYQLLARSLMGATNVSSETCTATGPASLGLQTNSITSCTLVLAVMNCLTSAPHGLAAGAHIVVKGTAINAFNGQAFGTSTLNPFDGWYRVATVPDNTHFTVNLYSDTRNGAVAAGTGGTLNYWNSIHIRAAELTGNYQFYVYGRVTGGTKTLIGTMWPQDTAMAGRLTDPTYLTFDDFGSPVTTFPNPPPYIPTTVPVTPTNDMLATTIASGAGTTSLVLAANAGNTIGGQTILFDDAVTFLAGATYAVTSGTTGPLMLPEPGNASLSYVFNSPISLGAGATTRVAVFQKGTVTINEPISLNFVPWYGVSSSKQVAAGFSNLYAPVINFGKASPGFIAFTNPYFYNLVWSMQSGNGATMLVQDSGGIPAAAAYRDLTFIVGTSTTYSNMALVARGDGAGYDFTNVALTNSQNNNLIATTPGMYFDGIGNTVFNDKFNMSGIGVAFRVNPAGGFLKADNVYSQGNYMPYFSLARDVGDFSAIFEASIRQEVFDTNTVPVMANYGGHALTLDLVNSTASSQPHVTGSDGRINLHLSGSTGTTSNIGVSTLNAGLGAFDGTLGGVVVPTDIIDKNVALGHAFSLFSKTGPPAAMTGCVASAGGSVPTGTTYYFYAPVYPNGSQGALSFACIVNVTGGNQTVTLNWTAIPGVTQYGIYRGPLLSNVFPIPPCTPVTGTTAVDTSSGGCGGSAPVIPAGGPAGIHGGLVWGQTLQLGILGFASLGAPPNGTFTFCPDCTIANPCAGAGTGALAKRLNGVWVCN